MILGILFPPWPSQRELERMTWQGRAQWGTLALLQFSGMLLGSALLIFG